MKYTFEIFWKNKFVPKNVEFIQMYNGESMFYLGLGVEQNFSESIHYLKMAIELGDSDTYFRKIY